MKIAKFPYKKAKNRLFQNDENGDDFAGFSKTKIILLAMTKSHIISSFPVAKLREIYHFFFVIPLFFAILFDFVAGFL